MSTARLLALSAEEGPAVLDSTVRLLEISASDAGALAVAITGITDAQAGQPIVLTAVVTGGNPTGYTWTQTAGPTLTPTREGDTYEALAPAARLGTTLTMQVTVDPGGVTDTHTITVHGATRFRLAEGGEWVPVVRYRLSGIADPTPTVTGYDGGDSGPGFDLLIDGGRASGGASEFLDGGMAA